MPTVSTFARRFMTNLGLEISRMIIPIFVGFSAFLAGYGEGKGPHPTPVNTALLYLAIVVVATLLIAAVIATVVQLVVRPRRSPAPKP
jgi:hypothetical protein